MLFRTSISPVHNRLYQALEPAYDYGHGLIEVFIAIAEQHSSSNALLDGPQCDVGLRIDHPNPKLAQRIRISDRQLAVR